MRVSHPLVAAGLATTAPLLMAAAPDAAAILLPAVQLTGNPAIDALIVAGVLAPAMAGAAWLVKLTATAGLKGTAAGLRAWADVVEARAKKTQDPNDDGPAHAGAAVARSIAKILDDARPPGSKASE